MDTEQTVCHSLVLGREAIRVRGKMVRFWQFIFEYCKEDSSCVYGWMAIGITGLLLFLICGFFLVRYLSRKE